MEWWLEQAEALGGRIESGAPFKASRPTRIECLPRPHPESHAGFAPLQAQGGRDRADLDLLEKNVETRIPCHRGLSPGYEPAPRDARRRPPTAGGGPTVRPTTTTLEEVR